MSRRLASSLLLVLGAASGVSAQLPDSPTGRAGNALIQIFGSGSSAVTSELLQETFTEAFLATPSLSHRQSWLSDAVERVGALQLRGVEKTGPFSARIEALSSLTGSPVVISYELEDSPPHRIARLAIQEKPAAPKEELTLPQMVAAARAHLEGLSTDEFSGTVLVARGDQVLLAEARGLASRRYQVPNRLDTRFNLGSINKVFTKIALAQLAAAGKLSFGDTLAQHLPDYPNPEVAAKITLQQIVTHSAGLADIFTEQFARSSKTRFRRPQDYFELFASDPLLFEPGTSERYSNGGYMVLGAVIDKISGSSYDEYVRRHIFTPAGMEATGSFAMDEPIPDLAMGYTRHGEDQDASDRRDANGRWRENVFLIPISGTPAGGGYSTVGDLLRFRHALVGHKLLDPRYTAWVVSDHLPAEAPAGEDWGIGVAGGAPGVNAMLEIEGEFTVVVLSNLDPPSAGQVARRLRDLIESTVD